MPLSKESKYLRLAEQFAQMFSKDQSTKVGAFFLHPTEFTILSAGYNGIPRGCADEVPSRHERPLKYEFFEHAERNAIYNAVRGMFRGSSLVCTAPMDVDDIRALISVGVTHVATNSLPEGETARVLLTEANVQVVPTRGDAPPNEATFFAAHTHDSLANAVWPPLLPGTRFDDSAVRCAIFKAARPLLQGSTVVVAPLPPCALAQTVHGPSPPLVSSGWFRPAQPRSKLPDGEAASSKREGCLRG